MQYSESFLCTALIGTQEKQQDFHVFQTGFKFCKATHSNGLKTLESTVFFDAKSTVGRL